MKKQGFSLIELMIVITIIGILAAVAVPSYQTYVIKTRLAELVTFTPVLKEKIVSYYAQTGTYPASTADLGFGANDITSPYLAAIDLSSLNGYAPNGGYFRLYINSTAVRGDTAWDTRRLYFGFRFKDGAMQFTCGYFLSTLATNSPPIEYHPSGCNSELGVFHAT